MRLPTLSLVALGIGCIGVLSSTHAEETLWRDVIAVDQKTGRLQRLAETPNGGLQVVNHVLNQIIPGTSLVLF